MRALVAGVLVAALPAVAHDVSVDVSGTLTTTSSDNPRAGAASLGLSGSWDVSDAWSLLGTFVYTRDFPTRSGGESPDDPSTFSPGSNVFLISAGVMWLASDHLMTMLVVNGSPVSLQPSATTRRFDDPVTGEPRVVSLVVNGRNSSLGGAWTGSWASNGDGAWESTVDLGVSVNRFDTFQRLVVPDTPRGRQLRQACLSRAELAVCQLVNGASTPLVQARLSAAYLGTLHADTDFALEGAYFLYDQDPLDVGFFPVVTAGRGDELGSGVPVNPLRLSVRPSVAHRFSRVTLKGSYQLGVYAGGLGLNHLATLRTTWKVTPAWRVTLTVSAQVDSGSTGLTNPGGTALLGAMFVF